MGAAWSLGPQEGGDYGVGSRVEDLRLRALDLSCSAFLTELTNLGVAGWHTRPFGWSHYLALGRFLSKGLKGSLRRFWCCWGLQGCYGLRDSGVCLGVHSASTAVTILVLPDRCAAVVVAVVVHAEAIVVEGNMSSSSLVAAASPPLQ